MRSSDISKSDHGWLRPDGKFFACGREGHLNLLYDLGTYYIEADKANWIKIGTDMAGRITMFLGDYDKGPTQSQINAVDKFCAAKKIALPWWCGGDGM